MAQHSQQNQTQHFQERVILFQVGAQAPRQVQDHIHPQANHIHTSPLEIQHCMHAGQ